MTMANTRSSTVKTPELLIVVDTLLGVLTKIDRKSIDLSEANTVIKAANGVTSAVSADVRKRLAAPRLREIDGSTGRGQ